MSNSSYYDMVMTGRADLLRSSFSSKLKMRAKLVTHQLNVGVGTPATIDVRQSPNTMA